MGIRYVAAREAKISTPYQNLQSHSYLQVRFSIFLESVKRPNYGVVSVLWGALIAYNNVAKILEYRYEIDRIGPRHEYNVTMQAHRHSLIVNT